MGACCSNKRLRSGVASSEGWVLQPCLDSRVKGGPPVNLPQVRVRPTDTVMHLIEETERGFLKVTQARGRTLVLQINLIWTDRGEAAMSPQDPVERHLQAGESFRVYGDIFPIELLNRAMIPESKKTPVLILTGFLGSGKTTLLNYILQEQREKKIAVIENEFGEISIDDELLMQNKLALAEKIVVMDNGCVCCTIRDDLHKGLTEILDMGKKGGNAVDLIVIETTGMADPVPIVKTFMSRPDLRERLRLDGILTVADARNLPGRLDDDIEEGKVNEAYQQIAFADKILLNKIDLISPEAAIACKEKIRGINKFAKILPAVRGRINVAELVNLRAHDVKNLGNVDFELEAEDVQVDAGHGDAHGGGGHEGGSGHGHGHEDCDLECGHGGGHGGGGHGGGHDGGHGTAHGAAHGAGHGHGKAATRHDTRVNSFALVREGELQEEKLSPWYQSLFTLPPERGTIFRIKGILGVQGYNNKHVFHAVMDAHENEIAGPWEPGEKKVSKIVFIGKALDQEYLRKGFEACFAPAPERL